jgi:hypothetical protein
MEFNREHAVVRTLTLPLSICLIFFLSLAALIAFTGQRVLAEPGAQQGQSRDALYVKCRREVFRRYGSPSTTRPGYRALPHQFVHGAIDQCVANGGRG